jgi:hypothetical protein
LRRVGLAVAIGVFSSLVAGLIMQVWTTLDARLAWPIAVILGVVALLTCLRLLPATGRTGQQASILSHIHAQGDVNIVGNQVTASQTLVDESDAPEETSL